MRNQVNILAHALEDDELFVELIKEQFEMNNIRDYRFFTQAEEFILAFNERVHLCILDYLPGASDMSGLDVMKVVISTNPNCKAIMVSGYKDYEIVVDALNNGCFRWVDKNKSNYKTLLVEAIQQAIVFIKSKIEEREMYEQLKADSRKRKYERNTGI